MNDRGEGDDPWSRDVPPAPAPTSFDFPSDRPASADRGYGESEPPVSPRPQSHPQSRPRSHGDSAEHTEDHRPQRRTLSLVAAAAVVALVVGGIAVATRSNPGTDEGSTADTAPTDTPSSTAPALERTTTAPPPTTRAPIAPRTTPLPTVPPPPPEWVEGRIVLPPRFDEMAEPTELVALTVGGKIMRISLPGGQTSTLDLGRRQQGGILHLGATNVLVGSDNGNGRRPTLLPATGGPIEVDIEGTGGINVVGPGPGLDEFTAFVWSPSGADERLVVIRSDGSVDDIDDSFVNPWSQGSLGPRGERWITDAGGVYLEALDGSARRVSSGQLIATAGSRLLVRECDEQRQCGWVVIDVETDERLPAVAPDGFTVWNQPIQMSALSPDGRSLIVSYWNGQDSTMIDLSTGEQHPAPSLRNGSIGNPTARWVLDSSGYFTVDAGTVTFVDRDTGEVAALAIEFDDTDAFGDVAVRAPTD